ncbi:hypothetical protein Scep_020140 [Stephania cephalantha]|uniref:Uncharacterized protein n=1 Tax=Stephania cephalantha TaxID=152367 RepID=A0AAP0ID44_9MAGN
MPYLMMKLRTQSSPFTLQNALVRMVLLQAFTIHSGTKSNCLSPKQSMNSSKTIVSIQPLTKPSSP